MPKKISPWKNRIVKEAEVDPAELKGNPQNWRRHPEGQRAALSGVLGEVGWVARIIVNQRTGHVVDGHLRLEEAFRRGEKTVPVAYVDLSEAEEREVLATFDPLGSLAQTDTSALEELLSGLQTTDAALQEMMNSLLPSQADTEIMRLELSDPPSWAWWLIGADLTIAGQIQPVIDALLSAHPEDILVETSVTN
jgi:ParB-like chromosome segregation protein Spo0J